jgi:hypothetical protein
MYPSQTATCQALGLQEPAEEIQIRLKTAFFALFVRYPASFCVK